MLTRVSHIAALFLVSAVALAQAPNPGNYSAAEYEVTELRGVMVTMRDGVRLAANIFVPNSSEKRPAILSITCYGKDLYLSQPRHDARWYARRGYVFVAVDSRGRYDSEGVWDPFSASHKIDGYDLVEWVAKQSWSNGKVGMIGMSYQGWTQWWTASTAPPHLSAIVPIVAPADHFENGPYHQGVLTGGWMPDWAAALSGRTQQSSGRPQGIWNREDYKDPPYIDINKRRGMQNAPWFTAWYQQNKSTDPYWQGISYQGKEHYSRIGVPTLGLTGWFDASHSGTPMNYLGMKEFGATPRARWPSMIIGPWSHDINRRVAGGIDYGPEAVIDIEGYTLRWLDRFLKDVDNGVEEDPPVYLFVMGENRWRAEQDWPLPRTKFTKYFLASGGHANSLKGDGVLTTSLLEQDRSDTYIYDPRSPTLDPYETNAQPKGTIDGALDTRLSAIGDDVLVYQTPILKSPVEVTGPIEAVLYAATTARDTDWMVRLIDVQPDGRALLLADGAMRARHRDPTREGRFNAAQLTVIEPNEVHQYTIRFWRGTANLFRAGHRIRVEISSSWYPFFLPNLNSGADNLATTSWSDAVVARQTVHHGSRHPSHILLPVIPARMP